ncbi:MAG: S-layer homology domain-containing protein [Oscillospiraceae bacterium]|nr:S-layer homology domain-containing protein [Oscillospiraceae bacterium]
MKKNSVILRVSCLCLALLLVAALPAAAAGGPEFRLSGPAGAVSAGEEFDVTIELTGNPGFCSIEFILGFDQDKLDCISITYGSVLSGAAVAKNLDRNEGAAVAAASASAVNGDGVVATLHFKAVADIGAVGFTLPKGVMFDDRGNSFSISLSGSASPEIPGTGGEPVGTEIGETGETGESGEGDPDDSQIPAPVSNITFSDVEGHWGLEYIRKAAEQSLFKGYEDGRFGPDDPVTRAQFVTVLYRMAGSPEASGSMPFEDTDGLIEEFKKAISWAYGNGYVNGRSETVFDPGGRITRQEAMKILFAYSGGVSGMEAMFTGIYDDAYSDSGDIASWAKSAMYWGVYHELIKGMGDGVIAPLGTATRAQLAKILVVYSEKF